MAETVLYNKKGCSTCVDALKWLKAHDMNPTVRDFFVDPLSRADLVTLLGERSPSELLSTRSPRYKALGLDQRNLTADETLTAIADDPYLMRRPTLAMGNHLIIGFDKTAYAALIS